MKSTNYIVVRTETRVKNFNNEALAQTWILQHKARDEAARKIGTTVEYEIWESPTPAAE